MSLFDSTAHKTLSNSLLNTIQSAIEKAINQSRLGRGLMCTTTPVGVLVLPEHSAVVRGDVTEILCEPDFGYSFFNSVGDR